MCNQKNFSHRGHREKEWDRLRRGKLKLTALGQDKTFRAHGTRLQAAILQIIFDWNIAAESLRLGLA
jgi:hypothetical protein